MGVSEPIFTFENWKKALSKELPSVALEVIPETILHYWWRSGIAPNKEAILAAENITNSTPVKSTV